MSIRLPPVMRAARIPAFGAHLFIDEVPVPADLQPGDVLIQVKAAGFCHSDIQVIEGVYESRGARPGIIGSHEGVGIIAKVGSAVEKKGILKVGDRVGTLNAYGYCGICDSCKIGPQLCDNLQGMCGITIDGAFAEYMCCDSRSVVQLPSSIPFIEGAPLFCAGATMYGALQAVRPLSPGQWIAIIGIGGLGHLGVQYAKAMGLNVIAIDKRLSSIDLALHDVPEHLRPDRAFLAGSEEARPPIITELGRSFYNSNPGVDRVIIATDDPTMIWFAQQFLRKGGILCDVGLPSDVPFEVDPFALNFKHQVIKGSIMCTPSECQEMIDLHAKNGCRTLVGRTFKLEKINELVQMYMSGNARGRLCVSFE